jgi:hypothetical protein
VISVEEKNWLKNTYSIIEPSITFIPKTRRYFHLYLNGEFSNALENQIKSIEISNSILNKYVNNENKLIAFGYMICEPMAPVQEWHIDYEHATLGSIFIPLTLETKFCATEFLNKDNQIIQNEREPFQVIIVEKRAVHRGVCNMEKYRRVVWYCVYGFVDEMSKLNGYEPVWHLGSELAIYPDENEASSQRIHKV